MILDVDPLPTDRYRPIADVQTWACGCLPTTSSFHRLGRFRDRNHDQQSHRAAALNLVTACIALFNCRYLGRAVYELRRRDVVIDDKRLQRLSPLGWDHINLSGDYVWSDSPPYDADGMRPLNREADPRAA